LFEQIRSSRVSGHYPSVLVVGDNRLPYLLKEEGQNTIVGYPNYLAQIQGMLSKK
jgi:hypothetical protein